MDNVTVQIEEGTEDFIITLKAIMIGKHLVASETGEVVLKTHDIQMWDDLLFEHHNDVIGIATFRINNVEHTITDPLWRQFLTVFTPHVDALYA